MDADVRGLGVRVTDKGLRTFILLARFPGFSNPTRRALGEYPTLSLEKARAKAQRWREMIAAGKDPKHEEERAKLGELRKQKNTFAAVAEEFIARHVTGQRTAKSTARQMRNELISEWGSRPITEITRDDVVTLIETIADRPAPYMAHLVLGHIRSLFNWAINRGSYGLESSPCDRLRPAILIGAKEPRQRVLADEELVALWRAFDQLGYPFGPLHRILLLTGMREREVADARWSEIDLKKKLWTVPPERFKSNATHLIPLTDQLVEILEALPRFTRGDYLFSFSLGEKPVSGFSIAKKQLDRLMTADLGTAPAPWVVHDIRRTVRTRLASLRVPDMVAEMVIGHGRRGYSAFTTSTLMRTRCVRRLNSGPVGYGILCLHRLLAWFD